MIAYSMCSCLLSSNQVVRHPQGRWVTYGMAGRIATRGCRPDPGGRRWAVKRSHAWLNEFGKLRWRIERRHACVAF
jgi:hypothetical protein